MKTKASKLVTAAKGSHITEPQAKLVHRELLKIERHEGCIDPSVIVEAARPTNAPLHPFFTWDDSEAAERYREQEARSLIRAVVIIHDDLPEPSPVRAFVHVESSGTERRFDGGAYLSTSKALKVDVYRDQILDRARAELVSWRKRYEQLSEFAKVIHVIDELGLEDAE